jgi:hypothetical protein
MDGGQQFYSAIGAPRQGGTVGRIGDLIAHQNLGIHSPEQEHQPLGLGAALQDIGPLPHIKLRLSLPQCCHLSPVIAQAYPKRSGADAVGEEACQVPKKSGLSPARRG